jgi:hypothetical protein
MHLLRLMHVVPLWVTALGVASAAGLYSIGLMLAARALFGVERLKLNNEVAGFKFAVVGVFYGVLLAFVVVSVWEDFHTTEAAVRNEAKAAVDLHRLTFALPVEGGAEIRQRLLSYTDHVRKFEWPSMALGKSSDDVARDLDQLSQAIFNVQPQGERELALYQDAIRLLTVITDNRNERLDSSDGSVPPVLWFVLIIGGAITLGYPAFFGSSNLWAQILMIAMLAVLVSFSLLLGLAFDYPFSGAVHISVSPFDKALEQMPPNWPPP